MATELIGGEQARRMSGTFSPYRVLVLARHTLTQLTRMRVFYFLGIFVAILIASSMFVLRYNSPEQELKILKDFGLGAMTLFVSVFAIVATSMLIPKDVEDRTLYTILSKPVLRIEYLLGKLLGVLMLIGVSLVVMDALFTGVLYWRQSMITAEQVEVLRTGGHGEEAVEALRMVIDAAGVSWSLQAAMLVVFAKGAVLAALTLLISTFASSSLFTIVVAITAFFIGHVQADARAFYEANEIGGGLMKYVAALIALVCPDFQLFNVVDAAVAGELIAWGDVGMLLGAAGGYMVVYIMLAWYAFYDKEL